MQDGNRGDAIEPVTAQRIGHDFRNLEVEIWKTDRPLTCQANHLGREVEAEDVIGALGEEPGKSTIAATGIERAGAVRRGMVKQERVIVVIVIPRLPFELREAIKVGSNLVHKKGKRPAPGAEHPRRDGPA